MERRLGLPIQSSGSGDNSDPIEAETRDQEDSCLLLELIRLTIDKLVISQAGNLQGK
jgi:hypothetical protein